MLCLYSLRPQITICRFSRFPQSLPVLLGSLQNQIYFALTPRKAADTEALQETAFGMLNSHSVKGEELWRSFNVLKSCCAGQKKTVSSFFALCLETKIEILSVPISSRDEKICGHFILHCETWDRSEGLTGC